MGLWRKSAPAVSPVSALTETDLKATVFQTLVECVDLGALSKLPVDEARAQIAEVTTEICKLGDILLPPADQLAMAKTIGDDLLGLGPLEPLLARDDISEIMVNGLDGCYAELHGRLERLPVRFASREQLLSLCQRAAARAGRRVDEASPVCDVRLPDGSRLNVILPPLAIDGPVLTIRKFLRQHATLDALQALDSFSPAARALMELIARCRCNILVTGGSGAGKTTLLNCLAGSIDADARIITCEDVAELQLPQPHVVRLETRPRNFEGSGEVTLTQLVRNALRMRPDRLIIGEVRGAEALDLLQAVNTGHDGSMGTLHANDPYQALSRLEALASMNAAHLPGETIRRLIGGGIDVIVHLARLPNGSRKLMEVCEVVASGDALRTTRVLHFTGTDAAPAGGGRLPFANAGDAADIASARGRPPSANTSKAGPDAPDVPACRHPLTLSLSREGRGDDSGEVLPLSLDGRGWREAPGEGGASYAGAGGRRLQGNQGAGCIASTGGRQFSADAGGAAAGGHDKPAAPDTTASAHGEWLLAAAPPPRVREKARLHGCEAQLDELFRQWGGGHV